MKRLAITLLAVAVFVLCACSQSTRPDERRAWHRGGPDTCEVAE